MSEIAKWLTARKQQTVVLFFSFLFFLLFVECDSRVRSGLMREK